MRRRNRRTEAFAIGIGLLHRGGYFFPVVGEERFTHAPGGIANTVEELKQLSVAIDVAFVDLPVVDAREPRLARVTNGNPLFQLRGVNIQRFSFNPVSSEVHARNGSEEWRIIV